MTDPSSPTPLSTLKELRMLRGLTQAQLAEKLGIAQSEISRVEKRENHHIDTLKKYIEGGLDGVLEVWVVVPGVNGTPSEKYKLV